MGKLQNMWGHAGTEQLLQFELKFNTSQLMRWTLKLWYLVYVTNFAKTDFLHYLNILLLVKLLVDDNDGQSVLFIYV